MAQGEELFLRTVSVEQDKSIFAFTVINLDCDGIHWIVREAESVVDKEEAV